MSRLAAVLVSVSLFTAGAAIEETGPNPDHAHGTRHVEDSAEGHHHGDADDHHENPHSPCHHHEAQPCFGHSHDLADGSMSTLPDPGISLRFTIFTVRPIDPPSLHQVFHIPIA